jgi:hypothetical protein
MVNDAGDPGVPSGERDRWCVIRRVSSATASVSNDTDDRGRGQSADLAAHASVARMPMMGLTASGTALRPRNVEAV